MTDTPIGKPTRAAHLRIIVNEAFIDPVEEAAKAFATRLEADYARQANKSGLNFSTSIDVNDYPEDDVVEQVVKILNERGWNVDPVPYKCAGGRAGSFWMSPIEPNRKF